jgi:hypothetical protein
MKQRILPSILALALLSLVLLMAACSGGQQPRSYVAELTSDDSMTIRLGQWDLTRYHSDKLGLDINYPSFLYHQDLPEEPGQELFMYEDISISVVVDSLKGMTRSASQQMMNMGADLVESGDDYSIQEGSEQDWDYYGKVMDDDTLRIVTIMLRYAPHHSEAVAPLRDWVKDFSLK